MCIDIKSCEAYFSNNRKNTRFPYNSRGSNKGYHNFIHTARNNKQRPLHTSAVLRDNKMEAGLLRIHVVAYPCKGWYAISNIFQYIIFYCPPQTGGRGEDRVMRDIWYKVGTQLRYAIFFFQSTMVGDVDIFFKTVFFE